MKHDRFEIQQLRTGWWCTKITFKGFAPGLTHNTTWKHKSGALRAVKALRERLGLYEYRIHVLSKSGNLLSIQE